MVYQLAPSLLTIGAPKGCSGLYYFQSSGTVLVFKSFHDIAADALGIFFSNWNIQVKL
jgi:hypothetical protein